MNRMSCFTIDEIFVGYMCLIGFLMLNASLVRMV